MNNAQRTADKLILGLCGLRDSKRGVSANLDADAESAAAVATHSKELVMLFDATLAELAFHAGVDGGEPVLLTIDNMEKILSACGRIEASRSPAEDMRAAYGTLHRVNQGV